MDKKLTGLLSVFFLFFLIFITFIAFNGPIRNFSRAKEELQVDSKTSLIFAFPLILNTNTSEKSAITLFARSTTNKPIADQKVVFQVSPDGIGAVEPIPVTTDQYGKATTSFSCNSAGIAKISAIINTSVEIAHTISVECK